VTTSSEGPEFIWRGFIPAEDLAAEPGVVEEEEADAGLVYDQYPQYPQGQYSQAQCPPDQHLYHPYPQSAYPQERYPQDRYPQDQPPRDQRPPDQYPQDQYPQGPGFAPVPQDDAGHAVPFAAPPLPYPALDREPARESADSLTAEFLLHGKRPAPGAGWRRAIYLATGGKLRIGESAADTQHRDLVNRVKTPVAGGHHRVAVLSLKGGVGKTTTVVGLGATLASFRGDRVIAVDANPDRGTLSDKVRLETAATIRDLLNERGQVHRYADVRAFTTQASSRLEVLASDRDPGVSVAFSAGDYCDAAGVLENFYSICITDCGTGLLHSAMSGVLRMADQVVLVSSPSVDGARSASATLDWLDAHDYGALVKSAVVVLSAIRRRSRSTIDLDRLEAHFAGRCRAVVRVPYDSHLEEGAEVELELLSGETAQAYLALAATVGDGFAWPRRLTSQSS
jgi:MinD-like ATPase involved in chromosome partitioning or flagellar assembly